MLLDILLDKELIKTKNEGRRLIKQNAVEYTPENCGTLIIDDLDWMPVTDGVLKVGKRRFLRMLTGVTCVPMRS